MSIKRMSLRFNLEKESERKAWDYLETIGGSKNKALIDIINNVAEDDKPITEIIRETIADCLAGVLLQEPPQEELSTEKNEDDKLILAAMDSFLC